MKNMWLTAAAVCASAASLTAAPIDLSTWTAVTLDFPGGQAGANWVLQPGNTSVRQVINADPSFFLNNKNQTSYSIDGSWRAGNDGDDDYMGFVFGYQDSSSFYLFDWKQSGQGYSGATAAEGMTIKKFTGPTGSGLVDLSLGELWENVNNLGDMEILAKNHGTTLGWVDNTFYEFHLDFNLVPGEIHVLISQAGTTLWDHTINDTTFTGGQFGFYNYSQSAVEYAGFEQTGGIPVDVPEGGHMLLLLGLGMGALVFRKSAMTRA